MSEQNIVGWELGTLSWNANGASSERKRTDIRGKPGGFC
jgi:hypothetical protein